MVGFNFELLSPQPHSKIVAASYGAVKEHPTLSLEVEEVKRVYRRDRRIHSL